MSDNDQRQDMREKIIIVVAVIFCMFILMSTDFSNRRVVYDCRISEISPDFPPEVREECRQLQREQYREHQKDNSRYSV